MEIVVTNICHQNRNRKKSRSNGGLHFLTFLIGGVAFAGGYYAFQKYRRRLIPTPTQYIGKIQSCQIF